MMSGEKKNGKAVLEAVQAAIDIYGSTTDELIPILNDINRRIGYLPKDALEEVSKRIKLPQSKLYAVATFYRMLSTKQLGRHVIQFCESAPCHVVGGREVIQTLKDELGIKEDETTPDGKWSLVTVSCLGVCGVGPVLVIDEDMYGNVSPAQIPEILARYS
jgi:NADH-quinone oxidoreductase subunit E